MLLREDHSMKARLKGIPGHKMRMKLSFDFQSVQVQRQSMSRLRLV